MQRVLLLSVLLMALMAASACPRERADGGPAVAEAKVTHPWQQDWRPPTQPSAGSQNENAHFDRPETPGPLLPAADSLDPAVLGGAWLQTCQVLQEEINLVPAQEQDLLELTADGRAAYHFILSGKDDTRVGSWRKDQNGALAVAIGGPEELPFYGQLFEHDFLYLWNYEHMEGYWYARIQPDGGSKLLHNHFSSSRGEIKITSTVQQSFDGTLNTGQAVYDISGFVTAGVLSMRFHDKQSGTTGYAMFLADANWENLHGAWWLDNWRGEPFAGSWTATAAP
jgi:hypothetical protein